MVYDMISEIYTVFCIRGTKPEDFKEKLIDQTAQKRHLARCKSISAQYALLSSDYKYAENAFLESIEAARLCNDELTNIIAYEGLAVAHYQRALHKYNVKQNQRSSVSSEEPSPMKEARLSVEEQFSEDFAQDINQNCSNALELITKQKDNVRKSWTISLLLKLVHFNSTIPLEKCKFQANEWIQQLLSEITSTEASNNSKTTINNSTNSNETVQSQTLTSGSSSNGPTTSSISTATPLFISSNQSTSLSPTSFSLEERIRITGLCAYYYQCMSLSRKYASMMRIVARYYAQLSKYSTALHVSSTCFPIYKIPLLYSKSKLIVNEDMVNRQASLKTHQSTISKSQSVPYIIHKTKNINRKAQYHVGWGGVQYDFVRDLIEYASNIHPPDFKTTVQLCFYLLSEHHHILSSNIQTQIWDKIFEIGPYLSPNIPLSLFPLPLLSYIYFLELPSHLLPHIRKKPTKGSIFLYNPLDDLKDENEDILWVENEYAKVEITLTNPYEIELVFCGVELETSLSCKIYNKTKHISVRPKSAETFEIAFTPKESGLFEIYGIRLHFAHSKLKNSLFLPYEHPYDFNIRVVNPETLLHIKASQQRIHIYEGETISVDCLLTNGSDFHSIQDVKIEPIDRSAEFKCTLEIEKIPSEFNLESGAKKAIPIKITGRSDKKRQLKLKGNKRDTAPSQELVLQFTYAKDKDSGYYREVKLRLYIHVYIGLIIDDLICANYSRDREVICRLTNYANKAFVLLHNENNIADQTTSNGLIISPHSTKYIPIRKFSNLNLETELPYEEKVLLNMADKISKSMNWQCENRKGHLIIKPHTTVQSTNLPFKTHLITNMSIIGKVQEYYKVGSLIRIQNSVYLKDSNRSIDPLSEEQCNELFKMSLQVYRYAPNGEILMANPNHFAHTGKLVNILPLSDIYNQTQEFTVDVYFLFEGTYRVSLELTSSHHVDDHILFDRPTSYLIHVRTDNIQ